MYRILILAVLLLAGCGLVRQTQAPPSIALDLQKATRENPARETLPTVPAGEDPPEALTLENGSLQVVLYASQEAETSSQPYLLAGSAPAGTVLTINEQIVIVDETQSFQVEIPLEDGPNLVEVIASNADGDEVETLLTIFYNP